MTKEKLIHDIQKALPGVSNQKARQAIDAIRDNLVVGLRRDRRLIIKHFGTFRALHKKERQGRNPKTGKIVEIKQHKQVSFKAGKRLKEKVNNGNRS